VSNNGVFLDTSFVIAIINNDDSFHQAALKLESELKQYCQIWITEPILFEIGNSFSKSNKKQVARFIQYCNESPRINVVHSNEELLNLALQYYTQYCDKDWSLTDCLSFAVMKKEGLTIAYSSDHHFEQAGFQYTLKYHRLVP
jgi:uncharacterized protein